MDLTTILFMLLIVTGALELFMIGAMPSFYYHLSIPVYFARHHYPEISHISVVQSILENNASQQKGCPKIIYKQLSENELAFREKFYYIRFRFCPTSLLFMHNKIECQPKDNRISVTGYLNWSALVFLLWLILVSLNSDSVIGPVIFFVITIILPYAWQIALNKEIFLILSRYNDWYVLE